MPLYVINDGQLVARARKNLATELTAGCVPYKRLIKYRRDDNHRFEPNVHWNDRLIFWSFFAEDKTRDIYWNGFGVQPPLINDSLALRIEVNFQKQTCNRRMGGMVVQDSSGKLFIGHSGQMGGGATGIGKSKFMSLTKMKKMTVIWPDKERSMAVVVCSLSGGNIPDHVARFVHEVDRVKCLCGV